MEEIDITKFDQSSKAVFLYLHLMQQLAYIKISLKTNFMCVNRFQYHIVLVWKIWNEWRKLNVCFSFFLFFACKIKAF